MNNLTYDDYKDEKLHELNKFNLEVLYGNHISR